MLLLPYIVSKQNEKIREFLFSEEDKAWKHIQFQAEFLQVKKREDYIKLAGGLKENKPKLWQGRPKFISQNSNWQGIWRTDYQNFKD